MNEMSGNFNDERSEYVNYDTHTPLTTMHFEAMIGIFLFGIVLIGAPFVWELIKARHILTAIGAVIFFVLAVVWIAMQFRSESILVFKDGILVTYAHGLQTKRSWKQIPWTSILHLDLSDRTFQIATTRDSALNGRVLSYLGKMDRKEKAKRVNELKSLQHRGDIPSTVRIVE